MLDRVQTGVARESSSLDTLQQADPKRLAELIQNEHPQTIALILSRLHSGPAVTLLSSLPAVVRADVAMRMAMLDQINPEILAKISGVVENKLQAFGELAIGSYGGARAVAEIFNRLDRTLSGEILTAIQKADGTLHDSIKHLMFVFEDLLALDVSALKEIVGKVDRKVLTIALKGVSEPLKTKLLSVMSQRSAEILREDMDVLGPVKIRDVQAAQGQNDIGGKRDGAERYVVDARERVCLAKFFPPIPLGRFALSPGRRPEQVRPGRLFRCGLRPIGRIAAEAIPLKTAQLQGRVLQLQQRLETEVRSARDEAMREGEKLAREQAGVEIKAALDQVSRTLTDMASLRGRIRRDTEKDLIALSLEVARRVLHRELSVDPDAIQGIARFALEKVQSRDLFRVRLHPAHERQFREVAQGLGNLSGVEVKADPALPLGGIVLETRGGDLDASIDTQLAEISRGFAGHYRMMTAMSEANESVDLTPYFRKSAKPWSAKAHWRSDRYGGSADRVPRPRYRCGELLRDPHVERKSNTHSGGGLSQRSRSFRTTGRNRRCADERRCGGACRR